LIHGNYRDMAENLVRKGRDVERSMLAERLPLIGPSTARYIQADPVWQKAQFCSSGTRTWQSSN